MRLDGRVALITGGANGIGRATAEAFVAEGAKVAIVDANEQDARALAGRLGPAALAVAADVSDSAAMAAAVAAATDGFGQLDILMCAAAVLSPRQDVVELDEAEWHRAMAVNVGGAFLAAKHAIPALRRAGGGSIILIASQMGRVAHAGNTLYCTTKGALLQLARGMALDHVDDKIRVNTLSPGGVATDRLAHRFGDLETAEAEWGPMHPMGRLGRPEEIARAALFLASDDSSFMTGSDLVIDGGYTAW